MAKQNLQITNSSRRHGRASCHATKRVNERLASHMAVQTLMISYVLGVAVVRPLYFAASPGTQMNGADPEHPELIFGIVAAVGTPIRFVTNTLAQALVKRRYSSDVLHLSTYTKAVQLETDWPPDGAGAYTHISRLMKRGNELRERAGRGDILAIFAAAQINTLRETPALANTPGRALVLRQLKHPGEIYALRSIYGDGFHVIGIYCPKSIRQRYLIVHEGMQPDEASELIARDENERPTLGQKFRDTFYLSDVFISTTSEDAASTEAQLERFLDLLFGSRIIAPHRDEYGMYLAHAAALRSSSLARQVGAAILSPQGEVLAVGANEVPRAGGGQYWEDEEPDHRDHVRGVDASDTMKTDIVSEILELLDPSWSERGPADQKKRVADALVKLKTARIMNLTEFTRAVHAEMEAICAAARIGVSIRGGTLYTSTFPCHGCAKHVVGAGICRLVYIEPYPKSLAVDLHNDAICVEETDEIKEGVEFEPFLGVAPRRYSDLFSATTRDGIRIRRKDAEGRVIEGKLQLRVSMTDSTYIQREAEAARDLRDFIKEAEHGTEENS